MKMVIEKDVLDAVANYLVRHQLQGVTFSQMLGLVQGLQTAEPLPATGSDSPDSTLYVHKADAGAVENVGEPKLKEVK